MLSSSQAQGKGCPWVSLQSFIKSRNAMSESDVVIGFETVPIALVDSGVSGVSVLVENAGVSVPSNGEITNEAEEFGSVAGMEAINVSVLESVLDVEENDVAMLELIVAQQGSLASMEVTPAQVSNPVLVADATAVGHIFEAMQCEYAVILSKHGQCFEEYMAANPCIEDISIPVRRARYSRDCYYHNVRRALQENLLSSRTMPRCMIFGKFMPMVSVFNLDGSIQKTNKNSSTLLSNLIF